MGWRVCAKWAGLSTAEGGCITCYVIHLTLWVFIPARKGRDGERWGCVYVGGLCVVEILVDAFFRG